MARSQNATFHGDEPESLGNHTRGASFARSIADGLASHGWSIGEIDDWRDAGFLVPLVDKNAHIDIVVSPFHGNDDRWILSIAPARYPGWIRRRFGPAELATAEQIHRVAIEIHTILTESGCSGFRWCWDALADSESCDREPMPAAK